MNDVIYWAVLLDGASKVKLLSAFPPKHSNVFAEHMTIVFGPTKEENEKLEEMLGKQINLQVVAHVADEKGQAVVVSGFYRLDNGVSHITISCAPGTKPIYSNQLISSGALESTSEPSLTGQIAAFTKKGWRK